jgi:hypothetical protein
MSTYFLLKRFAALGVSFALLPWPDGASINPAHDAPSLMNHALMEPLAAARFTDRGSPSGYAHFYSLWTAAFGAPQDFAFAGAYYEPTPETHSSEKNEGPLNHFWIALAQSLKRGGTGPLHAPQRLEFIRRINAFNRHFSPMSIYATANDSGSPDDLLNMLNELRAEFLKIPNPHIRDAVQQLGLPVIENLEPRLYFWKNHMNDWNISGHDDMRTIFSETHAYLADILQGIIAWPANEELPEPNQRIHFTRLARLGAKHRNALPQFDKNRLRHAMQGLRQLQRLKNPETLDFQTLYESTLNLLTPKLQDQVEDSIHHLAMDLGGVRPAQTLPEDLIRSPLGSLVALSMMILQALRDEAWNPDLLPLWEKALAEFNRQSHRFAPFLPHMTPAGALSLGFAGYWPTDKNTLPSEYSTLLAALDGLPPELEARFIALQLMQLSWHNAEEEFDQRIVDVLLPKAYRLLKTASLSTPTLQALQRAVGFVWLHYDSPSMRRMVKSRNIRDLSYNAVALLYRIEVDKYTIGGLYFEYGTQLFSYGWEETIEEVVFSPYTPQAKFYIENILEKIRRVFYIGTIGRNSVFSDAIDAITNPAFPMRHRIDNAVPNPAFIQMLRKNA